MSDIRTNSKLPYDKKESSFYGKGQQPETTAVRQVCVRQNIVHFLLDNRPILTIDIKIRATYSVFLNRLFMSIRLNPDCYVLC